MRNYINIRISYSQGSSFCEMVPLNIEAGLPHKMHPRIILESFVGVNFTSHLVN